jgi:Xaa-Pro aminopeptidase
MTEEYGLSFPLDRADWIEGVNMEALRTGRLQRAKEALFEQNDFGAFLTLNEWNTRYITSTYTPLWTTGSSGLRYAMLCRDADQPILYEQGDIGYHTQRFAPWLGQENVKYAITGMGWISRTMGEDAHEQQVGKFVDQIVEDLKRHGVQNQVLATDFYDPFVMAAFEKKGVKCSGEGGLVLMQARRNKLPGEVQCIRTTTTIGDAMFSALVGALRPGASEGEILGEMMRECYRLGGEVVSGCLLTSGPYTWPNLRHYTNRRVNYGDVVFADVFNASWNGYKTCYYRTFSVGEPRKATKEAYKRSLAWLYDAIDIIKPGVTTKEIAEKWPPGPSIWADIGVTNEDMTAGNHWGHGIGLSLYEPPLIWRGISLDHPMTIEEGMTFAIETQDGDREGQGVRIEEVVHVTKNGCEILSKWPVQEITVVEI